MSVSLEQRNTVLDRLLSCTAQEFTQAVLNLIARIDIGVHAGKCYICLASESEEKAFRIEIDDALSPEEQQVGFVHEVFHLPLILLGHEMGSEAASQYAYVEEKIEIAAQAFYAREPALVQKLFDQLRRPS